MLLWRLRIRCCSRCSRVLRLGRTGPRFRMRWRYIRDRSGGVSRGLGICGCRAYGAVGWSALGSLSRIVF
jgi:hypothetical protein